MHTIAVLVTNFVLVALPTMAMTRRPDSDSLPLVCDECGAALADLDEDHDPEYILGYCEPCDRWVAVARVDIKYSRSQGSGWIGWFIGGLIAGLIGSKKPSGGPPLMGPTRSGPPDGVDWPNTPR